eukprot:ctg_4536.g616
MVALAAAAVGAVVAIGDSLNSLSVRNLKDLVAWFDSLGPTAVFYYGLVYYVLRGGGVVGGHRCGGHLVPGVALSVPRLGAAERGRAVSALSGHRPRHRPRRLQDRAAAAAEPAAAVRCQQLPVRPDQRRFRAVRFGELARHVAGHARLRLRRTRRQRGAGDGAGTRRGRQRRRGKRGVAGDGPGGHRRRADHRGAHRQSGGGGDGGRGDGGDEQREPGGHGKRPDG